MIFFVVDSTFNIDSEYAQKNNVKIVSLKIELGDKSYLESDKTCWKDFYTTLKEGKITPKTSCPTPFDFTEKFDEILSQDKNAQIICMTFSNVLSGTNNACRLAVAEFKEKYKNDIELIDLQSYTCSSKLMLESAVEDVMSKKTFSQIVENIKESVLKTWVNFMPYSMSPLRKGGRVSLLKTVIADSLHIKPVMIFRNGELKLHKLAFGFGKGIAHMVAMVPDKIKKINLMYIFENSLVLKLKAFLAKVLNRENVEVVALGPIAGSHIGIGSIGIAVMEE